MIASRLARHQHSTVTPSVAEWRLSSSRSLSIVPLPGTAVPATLVNRT